MSNHTLKVFPVFLFLLMVSLTLAETVTYPSGEIRNTTFADFKNHPNSSKTYNEFWTYYIQLEGNLEIYFNISRANLGSFKSPVCGSDVSLIGFKGKTYAVAREYPESNFQIESASKTLRVHKKIWVRGEMPFSHEIYFETSKEDVDYLIHLVFTDMAQGKTWGDGIFKLGGEKIGIFTHLPEAKVTGKVAINKDTLQVKGLAYMDHTFQTDMGTALVHSGFRYSSFGNKAQAGYLLKSLGKYGGAVIGFGLEKKEGNWLLLKPKSLAFNTSDKPRGITMPKQLEIVYPEKSLIVERTRDRQQHSILSEFKGLTKWAVKKFMGGEVYYFRGTGKFKEGGPVAYNYFGIKD